MYNFCKNNCTKIVCENVLLAGKAGAKGADAKKIVKKSAVAKPNTIKSLFMSSNVKRPAEVCFAHTCLLASPIKEVPCPFLALDHMNTFISCRRMLTCPKMTC